MMDDSFLQGYQCRSADISQFTNLTLTKFPALPQYPQLFAQVRAFWQIAPFDFQRQGMKGFEEQIVSAAGLLQMPDSTVGEFGLRGECLDRQLRRLTGFSRDIDTVGEFPKQLN
jgi:hypothetical protein